MKENTTSYIIFLEHNSNLGFWDMQVYKIWVKDLFVHEGMKEVSWGIDPIFF
jgi:hypothetical protein